MFKSCIYSHCNSESFLLSSVFSRGGYQRQQCRLSSEVNKTKKRL